MLNSFLESVGHPAGSVPPPDTGITQLTGDVLAGPGSGSQVATVPGIRPPTEQTTTSTGTVDNFDLTGRNVLLRCNNASALTFTGFTVNGAAPSTGDCVTIVSLNAQVNLAQQTGSTAAHQLFNILTTIPTPLAGGSGIASYIYDGTTARWRMITHEQGAPIAETFDAADYTASGSMTWTVASGALVWRITGRQVQLFITLLNTTIAGTPSTTLQIALPSGWAANGTRSDVCFGRNNGTAGNFVCQVNNAGTLILVSLTSGGNWAGSAGNCDVRFNFVMTLG